MFILEKRVALQSYRTVYFYAKNNKIKQTISTEKNKIINDAAEPVRSPVMAFDRKFTSELSIQRLCKENQNKTHGKRYVRASYKTPLLHCEK